MGKFDEGKVQEKTLITANNRPIRSKFIRFFPFFIYIYILFHFVVSTFVSPPLSRLLLLCVAEKEARSPFKELVFELV